MVSSVTGCEADVRCRPKCTRTGRTIPERIVKDRAYSYQPSGDGIAKSVLSYANSGATSLFTTAEDLALWLGNFKTGTVGGLKAIEQLQKHDWELKCPGCGALTLTKPTDEEKPLYPTSIYAIKIESPKQTNLKISPQTMLIISEIKEIRGCFYLFL